MARSSALAFLTLLLLALFHGSVSQIEKTLQHEFQGPRELSQRQHRFRSQKACRLENLRVQEPIRRIEAEAGFTEIFDEDDDQFQCAGAALVRHVIEPKGLLLPSYSNSPRLFYVVQGRGIQGVAIPGCAETYQTDVRGSQWRREEETRAGRSRDQHQKIRRIEAGDIVVVPSGIAQWIYNRGQSQLILVSLFDTRNEANQLDQNLRKFYLAGNPERIERGDREGRRTGERSQRGGSIMSGFDDEILAEAFGVGTDLIRKIKGEDDHRDRIVRSEDNLEQLLPERDEEEERYQHGERRRSDNGIDETLCTLRLRHNIGRPDRADVFNPRAGRISTVNSQNLPALRQVRLNAEKGVLYSNAILSPHFHQNSHSIMYVTRGSGRVQVVDNAGRSVFDGEVREGQALVIPQNFVAIKKAGERGMEWIAFRTNDNAITNWLAGRVSQMRVLPLGVLRNAYRISREEAQRLKYNRQELAVFSPGRRQSRD